MNRLTTLPTIDSTPSPRSERNRVRLRLSLVLSVGVVVILASLLFFAAYVSAKFAPDATGDVGDQNTVPSVVASGGPIVDTTGNDPHAYRLPAKTIALTFDDGPDPVWTPKVLDVLGKYRIHATFFVVGSQVVRHTELSRRILADGHEIGAHTFTHPDVARLPGWRRQLEYSQTSAAIAYATGVKTFLLRFPYSSTTGAIDDETWPAVREAGKLGYLTVFNDTDSEDWVRPGVEPIIRNMTPPDGQGAIVLMHDAGGDRSQTVAALDRFIPAMQRRGYEFTTVTDGLNRTLRSDSPAAPALAGSPSAGSVDHARGFALFWAVRIADSFLSGLRLLFIAVGAIVMLRTLLLLVFAQRLARRRRRPTWSWGPPVTEPVSVIVPAYNERAGIAATVRGLAASDHPQLEIIVVDDGSTDGTADVAEGLGLANVRVVRKANGGKASALNTGIGLASHDIIVMVDGDTVFETDSIRRLVQPFADESVGAVAGNVKVGNRDSVIGLWQHIEYVIGFNLDRRLYETMGCMPTVPGAIGAFRRRAVLEAGGMSSDTLAEDTDITMAIVRAGWKVVYEPTARAWTEAPATPSELWRQRYRWSYGTMQAMWKHRRAWRDRGASGKFGRIGLPFLALFGVLLPLLAPILDLMAVYGVLVVNSVETAAAWLLMLGIQLVTAIVAFRLDRERLRPLWALLPQQFVYRQLMYLVLIRSMMSAVAGTQVRWRKLKRRGTAYVTGHLRRAEAGRPAGRDRWFDLLRAMALTRVVVYHMFGAFWLSFVFPAVGVMFALAGSLMAQSLGRSARRAVTGRIRRLLPALWLLGAVLVPAMLWRGWPDRPAWPALLTWVVPVAQPPGNEWAVPATDVLWYLTTYLWLVLLSPALLWLYRNWRLPTLLLPFAVLVAQPVMATVMNPAIESVITDVSTFGACWVVGFAHREGSLQRVPMRLLLPVAAATMAAGVGWAFTHPGESGMDLNDIPLAQGLYSFGFVLLLLRASPSLTWLARARPLDRFVTSLNNRAVTVYLWHNLAIAAGLAIGDALDAWALGQTGYLAVALLILLVPVLALGWVEDVAARRKPRLLPWSGRPTAATTAPAPAEQERQPVQAGPAGPRP